jgi:hypothetical protein
MKYGATIDPTGKYRYSLWRLWDDLLPKVLFIMLNPSTADGTVDDPTIRRCIRFAQDWGFGSLEVVNLFAYRATYPMDLKTCSDPVGPDNDIHIRRAAIQANHIVCAWGTMGDLFKRNERVADILFSFRTYCFEITKNGQPKHPLYIAANKELMLYPDDGLPF